MARVNPPSVRDATSLLETIRREALDPAYAEARRQRTSATGRPWPGRLAKVTVPLIALGVLIAMAAMQARRSAPDLARERAALVDRIDAESAAVDTLHREVERLRGEVASARDAGLRISERGREAADELAQLELATGATPVTGPGLRVIVDDAASPADSDGQQSSGFEGENRVLDVDLQQLVNGLWAAGAESVAINGQRLTSTTAIRAAGNAIVVAFRPLSRPYMVEAIGDPDELEARFVDGPGGRWFRTLQDNYGIRFEVSSESALRLPAASNVGLTHAVAVPEGGSS